MQTLPTSSAVTPSVAPEPRCPPWYRFPIVWLALAGPALVVVACGVTMAIAFRHADVAVAEAPARLAARGGHLAGTTVPALQARNHAATPAP